jgi:HAD superfamily hydrolase (TIGR01458 family)
MHKNIPILIDFDGVIKLGDKIAPDAKDFFDFINKEKLPACILSNSTLHTADLMKDFLRKNDLEVQIPSLTAFDATLQYVKKHYKKVKVYCRDYLYHHFRELSSDVNPEAVVIGDIGDRWNFETLNEIFNYVLNGSDLIAMHKNKFWKPEGKLVLDSGAFINAIEYATDKAAIVIGKPSQLYFQTALELLDYNLNDKFIMIGDDLNNDVLAAQKIGGTGILMLTGKTKKQDIGEYKPKHLANNLREVIDLISKT